MSWGWFSEYVKSLKSPWAEEIIDLFFYRPSAFLFVKVLARFPVTPNQISLVSMMFGVAAGFFLAWGDRRGFMLGAVLYGVSNIFDCCDGMIARLKKNGTATGRIVDGLVDYVTGVAVYAGLGIGLAKAVSAGVFHFHYSSWLLVVISAISVIIHAVFTDKYRNNFLEQLKNDGALQESEIEKMRREFSRLSLEKGHALDRFLIGIYIKYLHLQEGRPEKRKTMRTIQAWEVFLWDFIGPSTQISFLIFPVFFMRPDIFFYLEIGFANAWMMLLILAGLIIRKFEA
jgi:hypothetical protein